MKDYTPVERRGAIKILKEIEDIWTKVGKVDPLACLRPNKIASYTRDLRSAFEQKEGKRGSKRT